MWGEILYLHKIFVQTFIKEKLSQPQRQHNLNIVVRFDMKMTEHSTTPSQKLNGDLQEPHINIY